jgi:hypothetical protein
MNQPVYFKIFSNLFIIISYSFKKILTLFIEKVHSVNEISNVLIVYMWVLMLVIYLPYKQFNFDRKVGLRQTVCRLDNREKEHLTRVLVQTRILVFLVPSFFRHTTCMQAVRCVLH